ncbi:Methylated-DNA--protein-cysteine methyltransferase, inducible [Paenibacillus allorhizoplanae]|uniref:Methylated-DNA--protein-cysteine methyltransferase, inducible n=1 Tax=Paenibacillus allorhizoplanae TaxID=2905648 RepID=A0ABM9CGA2_9BACL|nr:methylated-DNA--[protein]-cysteine S-methyltransferase [Paenibacillus allorhizoplanae]CAH1212989.1 Methylated-DNA--protein-cysteine methyltransferase, inducible [Paenibacillus allorhizoplanae]
MVTEVTESVVNQTIYWGAVRLQNHNFVMAVTDAGLGYLQFQKGDARDGVDVEAWQEFTQWARKIGQPNGWIQQEDRLKPYMQQLDEYLSGERTNFELPLDLRGTEFQQSVWRALHEIVHGETVSYSQVAQTLDRSSAVRAVGTAIGANPVLIVVPCHRVVGKDGALTGYRGGLVNKEKLLQLERQGK